LLAFDGNGISRVDYLSSTGLCVAGDRLYRLLWADKLADAPGELLSYDDQGVVSYHRIDALREPHDVAWDGRELLVVSTATNSILRLAPDGRLLSRWQAPGSGDAWHLNSLLIHQDRVLACAFGRFRRHREWNDDRSDATGVVFDMATGRDVLTGLSRPHNPRYLDGCWLVCNSRRGEVVRIDPATGGVRGRVALGGWTRGVAVLGETVLVGVSARRHDGIVDEQARIAVLNRRTWAVEAEVPVPCREVYDLTLAPAALVEGARRGFRRNRASLADSGPVLALPGPMRSPAAPACHALDPSACRVLVAAQPPETLAVGSETEIACMLENRGPVPLASAPPYPIYLSYKWIDPATGVWLQDNSARTRLPVRLGSRQVLPCKIRVTSPQMPGVYMLRVTVVQEGVAWFDDLDSSNAMSAPVTVHAPEQPAAAA
jgi:hypothetical protein